MMIDEELEKFISSALANFVENPSQLNKELLYQAVRLRSPEQVAKMEVERGLKNG